MLGFPSAPRPWPPSILPIMFPRPASLNMPCMLAGPIKPPIRPPIIRGMPPELPGTSLMISKPGSSPALVFRSLDKNRKSDDAPWSDLNLQGCQQISPYNFCLFLAILVFQSGSRCRIPDWTRTSQNFTRDCSSSCPRLLHCHCPQKGSSSSPLPLPLPRCRFQQMDFLFLPCCGLGSGSQARTKTISERFTFLSLFLFLACHSSLFPWGPQHKRGPNRRPWTKKGT